MALKEGINSKLQEIGFKSESLKMINAVLGELGTQVDGLYGETVAEEQAVRSFNEAMEEVVKGEKLSVQNKALLEYMPWAILGRLFFLTSRSSLSEAQSKEFVVTRVAIIKSLEWEGSETEVKERFEREFNEIHDRLETKKGVDMISLMAVVKGVNTALFPNTAIVER